MPRLVPHRCPECFTGRSTAEGMRAHMEVCKAVRCPACRSRFMSFKALLTHQAETGHKSCDCGHGHHHPHRPGTRGCIHEPWDDLLGMPKGLPGGTEPPF